MDEDTRKVAAVSNVTQAKEVGRQECLFFIGWIFSLMIWGKLAFSPSLQWGGNRSLVGIVPSGGSVASLATLQNGYERATTGF
jgi:hypothetical protein